MDTPWGDDAVDDSSYNDPDPEDDEAECCHHDIGFDDDREMCRDEDWEDELK